MTTARELTNQMRSTLGTERGAMADFLLMLADFDAKKLWRDLGYASGFCYLRGEFKVSKGAAHNRMTAARLIQRFPEVAAALGTGDLCLSTIHEVAKVLTAENMDEVLPRFFGLSRSEAEQLAVVLRPVEVVPVREVVTAVRPAPTAVRAVAAAVQRQEMATAGGSPAPAVHMGELDLRVHMGEPASPSGAHLPEPTAPASATSPAILQLVSNPRDSVEPFTAEVSRLHLTVTRRFLEKLQGAKDDFAHACPGGGSMEILEHCIDLAREVHRKRRGLVEKPLKNPRPSHTDAIPAHVKRAVWLRAGGRCEWILESGERCGCTRKLEFDHVRALALGGKSTIENVRLACRPHNLLAARRAFGDEVMDRYARRG